MKKQLIPSVWQHPCDFFLITRQQKTTYLTLEPQFQWNLKRNKRKYEKKQTKSQKPRKPPAQLSQVFCILVLQKETFF